MLGLSVPLISCCFEMEEPSQDKPRPITAATHGSDSTRAIEDVSEVVELRLKSRYQGSGMKDAAQPGMPLSILESPVLLPTLGVSATA